MGDSLYVTSSGAAARLAQLEIVANNLANSDTVGFKRDTAVFKSAFEAALTNALGESVPGAPGSSYVGMSEVRIDHRAGPLTQTGAPLHAAIRGPGFFRVETPAGIRYTRAGAFRIDDEGTLVTPAGFPVLGKKGPIDAGSAAAHLEVDGRVVDERGRSLGSLEIVRFDDLARLTKEGHSLFRAPDGVEEQALDAPALIPGATEKSNVQPIQELAALVVLQRAFDAQLQILESEDEISQRLIQEISN